MTYIPALEKVQIGLEATYADGAAATVQLVGVENCRIDPHVDAQQLADKRGDAFAGHDAVITKRWSEGVIEGFLNYQQTRHWLDGMFGYDASSPHTYLATADHSVTEKSLALYYGQTGGIYKAAGVLPTELVISGGSGEPVKFSFKWFGQPAMDSASFAALSDPAVAYVMGSQCSLYLDSGITSNPGTTLVADSAFRFEFRFSANRKPVWHLGDVAPDSYRNGKWTGSLKLVLESTTGNLAHVGDIIDATVSPLGYAVMVRATNASQILDLKSAGHAVVPPVLITDEDGITTVELTTVPAYGSHASFLSSWGATLTLP